MVVWLFLAVPWVCVQFVIVVFDHTHLLFLQLCSIFGRLNFAINIFWFFKSWPKLNMLGEQSLANNQRHGEEK